MNWILLATIWFAVLADARAAKPEPGAESFHPTRVLARFKAGEMAGPQNPVLKQHGLGIRRQSPMLPQVVVLDLADRGQARAAAALPPQARAQGLRDRIAALQASGRFEYVEPDYIRTLNAVPTDSAFTNGTLWALRNLGQNGGTLGADIDAVAAWDITTGSTNVIVAVIDTGINYTHQDLDPNLWRNPGESGAGKETNGLDDDGDGYVDNVFGINAITGSGDPMDDNGHGSHVSGTIGAAANNGGPHVGVAWNVRLMACKFLDSGGGSGYASDGIECLQFAVANGARIVNASFGGPFFSQAEYDAIKNLRDHGVLFVAAAGNGSADNNFSPSYPASYDLHNIISVAAVDHADNLANFSNYGRTNVHLGAPGSNIFSCTIGSNTNYVFESGTSMAAPHVVGAAALVLSQFPDATLTELRRRLLDGAVPIPSLTSNTVTGGRLNVFNSLLAAPTGILRVELFPRPGTPLAAGKSASVYAVVSDLLPVSNATVTASITAFTNLALLDGGSPPDAIQADGVHVGAFLVPTNLTSLEITVTAAAPGWPSVTEFLSYPVVFPPGNDDFANRTTIPPSSCLTTVSGANINASKETGEPIHAGRPDGRSVWWSWIAPFAGPVKISTAGSSLDTLLAVYTGSAVSNLALITENDDAGGYDLHSVVRFDAVAGTQYQIVVDGFGAQQGPIILQILPLAPSTTLAAALDTFGFVFTNSSEAWLGQNCVSHDGTNAARSGPVDAYGESWMETSISGPGTLSFWWKVSSQADADYLRFYLDGIEQLRISGEVDWQQQRHWLGVTNTAHWAYTKNNSVNSGQDAGWVDQVSSVTARRVIPGKHGDLDGDGLPTVLDLTLLIGYLRNTNSLLPQVAAFADVNRDGLKNTNDVTALANAILGRIALLPALDTDGDGILDVLEPLLGLNPSLTNSPGSEFPDGERDFDGDGLSNARELQLGTDPLRRDTDGDGWADEAEFTVGSSPLDANSKPSLTVVSAPRVALVLPANQGGGGFMNNTVIATPRVNLVLPANQGTAGLSNNTVVAALPLALLLPANQGGTGVTNHTVIAAPTIALLLPADQGANGLTNNTVVARPPVALLLPANQDGGFTNNTVIAMPPVRLELRSP